jgi:hypothetical protein
MPSIKFLRETNGALCDIWNIEDGITEAASSEMAADKDGPEVEALWIEDAINVWKSEIKELTKKKKDLEKKF